MWPATAEAHKFGLSLVQMTVGDSSVDAHFTADLEHWNLAAGLDSDRNNRVTDEELHEGREAIAGYLSRRVQLTAADGLCKPSVTNLVYDAPKTAGHVDVTYECGVPLGTLVIANKAFREQPGNHQWIAIIVEAERRHRVVFDQRQTEVTYEATPPEAPEVVEQTDTSVEAAGLWPTARDFLVLGIEHILFGFDHILFVLTLLLVARRVRQLVTYVTAFTVAHSITLGLAALEVLSSNESAVEVLIAASIMVVAIENILRERSRTLGTCRADSGPTRSRFLSLDPEPAGRGVVVFAFGLIHGFGFAGQLAGIGLPDGQMVPALVSFNLGVELGQLAIVAVVWPLLRRWMPRDGYPRFVMWASGAVGLMALWWVLERSVL